MDMKRGESTGVLKETSSPYSEYCYSTGDGKWTRYFYPAEEPAEYRPYETIEEAMDAWGKILVSKKNPDEKMVGESIYQDNDGVRIRHHSAEVIFAFYTFADGSPVGAKK